jgi:divalent anion:Na+ symporter, DASS family
MKQMLPSEIYIDFMKEDSLLSLCESQTIAKLFSSLYVYEIEAGEVLFEKDQSADMLYLIYTGKFEMNVPHQHSRHISEGYVGEEAVLDMPYVSQVRALTNAKVLAFSSSSLQRIDESVYCLKEKFQKILLQRHASHLIFPPEKIKEPKIKKINQPSKIIGWASSIIMPLLIYWVTSQIPDLNDNSRLFLSIFSITMIMWIFSLVPIFLPALFAVLVVLILGIVPADTALSGFASSGFFLALSVFAIELVLTISGLTYRLTLWVLRFTPISNFGYNLSLTLIGTFLTPLIPSVNARIGLVSPILRDVIETLEFKKQGITATNLSIATFTGVSLFSAVFLTSKSLNLILFSLLSVQVQSQFQWLFWFFASSVSFVVLFTGYVIFSYFWLCRRSKKQTIQNSLITRLPLQQHALGPMNSAEWIALIGIVLFLAGVMTSSIHKINPAWIGIGLLFMFVSLGALETKHLQKEIDWPFLILVGAMVGITESFSYLGIDKWIGLQLKWLGVYMQTNFELFILLLTAAIFIIRLALPINLAVIIVATMFLPLAEVSGVNPWIIAFIILTLGESWIFPYQCSYYLQFQEFNAKEKLYDEALFLKFNMLMNGVRLLSVYASLLLWKQMGIH